MQSKTAYQLYQDPRPRIFTTGCSGLDSFLGGGIPIQGLTEICGESGAGKTQLCMQLLLTAQRPKHQQGLNGKTLFLSCEGQFPVKRLQEIAEQKVTNEIKLENESNNSNTSSNTSSMKQRAQHLIDNVLVTHIENADQLMDVMTVTLPMELRRGLVKLVIVDSIAAVCRGHFENSISGLTERADVLVSMAAYMKQMSDRYGVAFVVVNQISACFQIGHVACEDMASSFIPNGQEPPPEKPKFKIKTKQNDNDNDNDEDDSDMHDNTTTWQRRIPLPKVVPCLGVTWSNCINTRIMLTRGEGSEEMDGFLRRREMRLLLSCKHPCGTMCHYHVNSSGVERVEDEMMVRAF